MSRPDNIVIRENDFISTEVNNEIVICDTINEIFKFNNDDVKVYGTYDKIYFKAKDVSTMLDYKDPKSAIRDNVSEKNKCSFKKIYDSFKGGNQPPLTGPESQSIYINEAGVYQLIFKSKNTKAIAIQDFVFEEVLPSIRKRGSFQLNQQLKLKDIQLEEKNKALQIAESKALKLTQHIKNNEILTKNGYVYFITTKQYAANNQYRFGRSGSINKRIASYQDGRADGDKMYYVFVHHSEAIPIIEILVRRLLEKFRDKKTKDFYVIPWSLLLPYITSICENYSNFIISNTNNLIIDNLDYQVNLDIAHIPEPWKFNNDIPEADVFEELDIELDALDCPEILDIDLSYDFKIDESENSKDEIVLEQCYQCNHHCFEEQPNDQEIDEECKLCPHHCFEKDSDTSIDTKEERETKIIETTITTKTKNEQKCIKCKDFKDWSEFELNRYGKKMRNCITCRNADTITCIKCKTLKKISEFDIDSKKQRYARCKDCRVCIKVMTKCQKCEIEKTHDNFKITSNGSRYRYCISCQNELDKNKTKKCKNCNQHIHKSLFPMMPCGTRSRRCEPCNKLRIIKLSTALQ